MARSSRRLFKHQSQHVERLEGRVVLASAVAGVGTGLIANYFADQELQNLALTRVDPTVDFDWGAASPGAAVPADHFSARWTGKVQAQFNDTYSFHTQSDEGVALWVNGQKIIDHFTDHTFGEDTGTITLKAGEFYDIRVDYYDNQFGAAMKLLWSSPSTPKAVIPQTQLYNDAGWTSGAWLNTDVGDPSAAGSVSSFGKTYTVKGGGHGTTGSSDQFHYLYQTLNGDGVLIAHVAATQGTATGSEAGVMIRESLAANAKYVGVFVDANGVGSFETRGSTGGSVVSPTPPSGNSGKYWVKLVRDGNFFRGYTSATGADASWLYFGSRDVPMSRTVHAGVTATSGGNGGINHAQFTNVSLVGNVPLGAGLDAVRDWGMGQIFVDVAKSARTPQGPNLGPSVPFDAAGWPMADFMTIFVSGHLNTAQFYNGVYKGSFTGQADLDHWVTPKGSILNKSYDAATNTTYFELTCTATATQEGWYIGMNFRNTRRTPDAPLNSGITNLRVIRPGYDFNTTQVFRTEYLEHLKHFSVLRFMDWTQTNDNKLVNWSDRTKPNDARQSGGKGVAWEYVIQLANMLDKDVWINVPANANDDYIANLAAMMRDGLEPDRVAYVEYSNEVWNGIFDQFDENFAAAVAEVNAGASPLNADGSTNQFYWGWRRVGKRTKEISDIFADVWGASAINARVRPVLAGQHANPEVLRQSIEFIERTYGAPSKYLYGIATAPYFAYGSSHDQNTLSVDQILNLLKGSINGLPHRYWQHDTYARRYGLANMTYEGGSHVTGSANLANKIAAQLDPRIKDLVKTYLNGWYAQGGGLFEWFVAGPTRWTHSGMWGVSNAIDNYTAPKALGNFEVAAAPRQPLTYGIPVPASFDARAVAGATLPYASTYLRDPNAGNSFDYFVRAPRASRYRISFTAGTAGTNEQLRLAVNGSAVRTVTMKNTGSATTFQSNVVGTFDLAEGMNLLHFTSVKETTWNIQTVTVEPAPPMNGTPTVATAAAASNQSADHKTVKLSVLGADNGGEANLLYSWEAVDEQPLSVSFAVNGTNGAKNTTATFSRAGTYRMRVTISDGLSATTSSVTVVVAQQLTSIAITPSGTVVANGESRQFNALAKDQFGNMFATQPKFVWSVDNDFGTVSSTGLYTAPASGLGTATVRATASDGSISGTASITTQSPKAPENPPNLTSQIEYRYYEGSWTSVPNFDTLTPVKSGLVNNISIAPRLRTDHFAFQYTGYVYVPSSGTYTFYTTSDDGSKLWISGQQVVDNDGTHSAREESGAIILDAGWHSFKVGYFDATGTNDVISASFSGPGLASKQLIPDANLKRVNQAPTFATLPTANPNPVIDQSAELSVVGHDESGEAALTYTWSTAAAPSGAPAPVFSANGTNASKNATVTFGRAGAYTLQVAVSDGMLTTTSTVDVVVDQTITSIAVSPATGTVKQNRTQQFSATAKDQFGNTVSNTALVWSVAPNGGTITANGLYTAPGALGNYTVTATAGTVSGTANVTVVEDFAPTVATPASASPNPASDGQTQLSVLGADDGGEANLTYTWAATTLPDGAAQPAFSGNGTNAAKTITASGLQSGSYTFTATISDGFKSATSSVNVQVGTTSTAPTVATPAAASPSPVTGTTTALSVLGADQNGEASLTYSWSTTGTPPAPVTFSANGTNAAKNSTATFARAGAYGFVVTISNGTTSTTSSVTVTVQQTLTSVAVSPASASVVQGETRQFTASARDQFGQAMASQPGFSWSIGGNATGATISSSGLYTAPTSGTPTHTVIATAAGSGITGSASVTVTTTATETFTANQDIGGPAMVGSYSRSGDTHVVSGGGADLWNSSDQFHYVYRAFNGDGQIVARVASVQNTNGLAKVGVMFRESLAANAEHVTLALSPDGWTRMLYRELTGGATATTQNTNGSPAPYWIKLVRAGSQFTGYRSPDGVQWTQVGTQSLPGMAASIYVGLAVTARDNTKLNTSSFDNVSVTAATTLTNAALIGSTPKSAATSASAMVDGSMTTYFESADATGAWVGVDFGSPKTITHVKFAPRKGHQGRMIGGTFQVSNTADFSGEVVDLFVIKKAPKNNAMTAQAVAPGEAFRYVRYLAPDGSFGNIAETSFIGF